jgi:hypothetical protein
MLAKECVCKKDAKMSDFSKSASAQQTTDMYAECNIKGELKIETHS